MKYNAQQLIEKMKYFTRSEKTDDSDFLEVENLLWTLWNKADMLSMRTGQEFLFNTLQADGEIDDRKKAEIFDYVMEGVLSEITETAKENRKSAIRIDADSEWREAMEGKAAELGVELSELEGKNFKICNEYARKKRDEFLAKEMENERD